MERDLPALGKIPSSFFDRVIFPRLGRPDASVLVGPKHGVDIGVVDVGNGQVMAVTTDPFFIVPAYGWARAGWFAVHILASDAATSGLRPRYMSIDLNLPPAMTEEDIEAMWQATHEACDTIGINVVTGHTGRYTGCDFPMVGGCTVMAVGARDQYVASGMSRVGDAVLMTKGCAIEAAGLMAVSFPAKVAGALGADLAKRAEGIFWKMSTVEDSMIAVSVGVRDRGITAMHDATECGVLGGLYEMALAAGVGMRIDHAAIPLDPDIARICQHFGMDPYTSISEGTLLATCVPSRVDEVLAAWKAKGIVGARIGECTRELGVFVEKGGAKQKLEHPRIDPFWAAFDRAAKAP
jgi:hydrogenase expression/formation protein HypE